MLIRPDPLGDAINAARSEFSNGGIKRKSIDDATVEEWNAASRSAFANSKSRDWLVAQGPQDAIAEEVMELTEHAQCYCRSCVYARREGVAK